MNQQNPPAPPARAYLLLTAVVVLWGVNWPIMKMGLDYLSPLWFAATRIGLGALCLFALLAVQGRLLWPGRRNLGILVSIGILQIALPTGLIHTGLMAVEAGRSAILVFTIPLWVAPMAVLVLGERMGTAKLVGLALGLSGIAVLFNPLTFPFNDPAAVLGNAFMVATSLSFAVAMVIVRRHRWTVPTISLLPWQMLFGAVLLSVAAAVIEGAPRPRWSPALAAVMAYNGPIASAFCFWAFVTVSRSLPAMTTALGSLGVPVVGMVSAAAILGETLGFAKILGLVLISLGIVAVSVLDLKPARSG